MNKNLSFSWKLFPVLLLIAIPGLLVSTGLTLRDVNGLFSTFAIDPEFSYLYSGVLLAQGKINLFIDHPGTPLIVFAAFVIRLLHLFRPSASLAEDVMQNPDVYLNAINISLIIFIALVIFVTGWWVYRKTGNLPAALLLQFLPFVAENVFTSIERYMPEPMLMAVVILLLGIVTIDIHGKLEPGRIFRHRAVIYGIVIGFGISLKFTFGAFLIIPLFLLGGFRNKGRYLLATVVSFLVFTFPLIKRGRYFYEWIKSIFMHSGKHGSGEANILDPGQFITNLNSILQTEKHLTYALIIAAVILLLCLIPFIHKRIKNKKLIFALGGVSTALMAGILAISKHFAFYYLIPYSLLTVFIAFLVISILLEIISYKRQWLEMLLYAVFAAVILSSPMCLPRYKEYLKARNQKAEIKRTIIREVEGMNFQGSLILSSDNWHIRQESGLFFGMLMTPGGRNHFGHILNKHHPDTYIFKEREGRFYDWFDQPHEANELMERYPEFIAIIKHYNPGVYEKLEAKFAETGMADIEVVYQEPSTKLQVYRINSLR
jgi:hypothetical protein